MSSLSISQCHYHELTPSTAYTRYTFIPRSTVSRSQPVSHLLADVLLKSLHSHNYTLTHKLSLSCCRASLQMDSLQVLLQSRSLMACKYIFYLSWAQRPTGSLSSLHLGLQVDLQTRSITASQRISKLTPAWPPSASRNSLDDDLPVHLQNRSIMASKCISLFTRSRPPFASPN